MKIEQQIGIVRPDKGEYPRNGSSQSRPGAGGADFGVNKRGDEILLETTQIKQRLPFIDLIRGITIIEMISYHFLWDLVYLYNADIPWYNAHVR